MEKCVLNKQQQRRKEEETHSRTLAKFALQSLSHYLDVSLRKEKLQG